MIRASGPTLTSPAVLLAAAFGAVFAAALYPVWGLEGRWFVIVLVAIGLVSVSMMFAGRFSDFLLVVLLFCVPLAGFTKWLGLEAYPEDVRLAMPISGTLGLGITDFLVAGMYLAWGWRIFVMREERLPRLERLDGWVGLLLLASALSLWGSQDLRLGVFAFEHLVKHALVYFYVSRHLRRDHLPWLAAAIAAAILLEGVLGVLQYREILPPGLILDKGAGSERLEYQYLVPGIEDVNRATGTTYDSHSLGIYLAMLLPYAVAFLYRQALPARVRLGWGALLVLGTAALVFSYSRSAWLSFGIAALITVAVLVAWRDRHVAVSAAGMAFVAILSAPWVFARVFERFFTAPKGTLTVRFDQFPIAWDMWRDNFLFGSGAGNYMLELNQHNMNWAFDVPVHNVPLFIGAELGLFGVVVYYGLILAAMRRLWGAVRERDEPVSRFALAAFAGLPAYVFDGMSDPLFRESVVYMMFWITVALGVALPRIARAGRAAGRGAAP